MRLIEIDLRGCEDPELVVDDCWAAGATGVWEVDGSTLRVGVEDDDAVSFLTATARLSPVDVTEETAVELAGRWSAVDFAGRRLELWVPPTVFGDGHHPTTATCLELLPSAVGAEESVLDVGCGAGALSLAASVLGGRVTAIDIDPEAVEATAANAHRNGVAVEASAARLDELTGTYDVVLANLTSGALAPLVPELVRVCAPGGALVLSGMLEWQWPPVRDVAGGHVRDARVNDGWLTAVVDR